MKLKGLAILALIVAMCALVAAAAVPPTPFMIYGYVLYENGSACDNPVVNVTNLNTSIEWQANSHTSSNDYYLTLAAGADLNERETLRFDVSSPDGKPLYTTEHAVSSEEINNGGIFNFNFPPGVTAPALVVYTISNRTITAPQTTEIDVKFSEEVEWTIAVEDSGVVYDWSGTSTNPNPKIWNGTFETNGTVVPDGIYTVRITWINTTMGLGGQNSTETITVSSLVLPVHNLHTGEDFATIQAAIDDDDTEGGHTITVDPGTYTENVIVNKRLNLTGIGMPVIEDAGGDGTVVKVTADYVNISNFTVRNSGYYGYGIHSSSSHNTFMNANALNTYVGIFLDSSHNNTLMNNNVSDNTELGISLVYSSNNKISNCTVLNNPWCGINIDDSQNNQVSDCTISDSIRGIDLSGLNNQIKNCTILNNEGAIDFDDSSNSKISGCTILNNSLGIRLENSINNQINNCTISNNIRGIYLCRFSKNNRLRNNVLSNNTYNFGICYDAISKLLSDFYQDIDTSNTINGKPIYYLVEQSDHVFDGNSMGYLGLVSCDNITVKNINFTHNDQGLLIVNTTNTMISNCVMSNNRDGIGLRESVNNKISGCTISNNSQNGIYFYKSSNNNKINGCTISNNSMHGIGLRESSNNNKISGCTISNSVNGITFSYSINNQISNCEISNSRWGIDLGSNNRVINSIISNNSKDGIYLFGSSNCQISGCTVSNNSKDGIYLCSSSNNLIFHNNFINNSNNADDNNPENNDWYHPFFLEGNHWSDYTGLDDGSGTGKHALAGDGIGDTDIPHPAEDYDFYPFVNKSGWPVNKLYVIKTQTDKTIYYLKENATVSCTVQNETGYNITADSVNAGILKPDSLIEWITMTEGLVGHYNGTFTNTSLHGTYNVTIYANKTGYVNNTAELWFEVSTLPVHNIDTGEDFATIQAAIDDAGTKDGHAITVDPGTYNENVNVNKQLTIRSISGNPTDTIVQAANPTDHVFEVTADSVNISGFTVESATGDLKAGIYLGSADHCNISGNTANLNNYGISLWQSSNNTLENNTANSNNYAGIHLYFSSNTTLTNSIILNNVVGIGLDSSSNNTIISNNISHNGDGIFSFDLSANDLSSNNNIFGNTISNNGRGILLIITSSNNIIINNTISNNDEGIIFESASNNNTITNNTVNSNNNYGIYLKDSSYNLIFHNNLVNNSPNAEDANPASNDWHHPALLEGNYWSDYAGLDDGTGTGKHAIAGDGIGDTNIPHPAEDYDFYPFMTESVWTNTKMSVETATGTGSATLSTTGGYFSYVSAVNESSLPSEGKPNRQFPHGFFSFNITGLTTGQTVNVTIALPSEMPTTTQYWKYQTPEGWYQIHVCSNDGDDILTIQLTDGGTGDDDGIANGMIVDPGGPALPPPAKPDLEITDKFETWLENGNFTVTYMVKNIGDANASASDTTIFIDGVDLLEDPVPVLAPDASYNSKIGPFDCPCDHTLNITICADNADIVDESNETNNCRENELVCPSCVIQSYGNSISSKRNVRVAWRVLGEPDRRGALMLRNARIAIELNETIPECEKVSVWVRRVAVQAPTFDVEVSSDGDKWTQIGSATCYTRSWQRFEFTNDCGDWKDIKYIGIRKTGGTWRPKLMGLDAVCAEGRG